MGIIRVENIRIYSNHGCLQEEARIGSHYRVDVAVKADLSTSAESDKLADTVDYVQINKVVEEEVLKRSELLEHVVERVLVRLLKEIPMIEEATVALSKLNPPIGGDVQAVTIEMTKKRYDFSKKM
ncbi:dihydroneopterin aldolase [Wenyingzhuangia sp. 2_MG-2023]|uniref:dihydroneopterin aldolase n=1 Tax=Wenyingzhuangia sp. 2_MG-2023 TaxID=3062639 RepID=UPI0026E3EB12|nr:dihydroneopterin aldolase [Wenyingzhuangia sp. 2_MG-2023]MDO6736738.1 dihydroneopterin aldolase [Wenyingzhuangia sp. 2_MG-2023]MDO6800967.1 dihydroneopterin aldolase [Wenyingzhuangia sp. 1_MG-2023]